MLVNLEQIKVTNRIRKDFGDIQELADDIKENGLINPPVVNIRLKPNFTNIKTCEICGIPFTDRHHIIPKEMNGKDMDDNISYLCPNHHQMCHFLLDLDLQYESEKINKLKDDKFNEKFQKYKYILSYEKDLFNYYEHNMKVKIISHMEGN